ncbi:unnamed protein product, partial [Diamesa tonsa]
CWLLVAITNGTSRSKIHVKGQSNKAKKEKLFDILANVYTKGLENYLERKVMYQYYSYVNCFSKKNHKK